MTVGKKKADILKEKQAELSKIQEERTTEEENLRLKMHKHMGGEIKFHGGDEVSATLLTGEGVLNRMAMQAAKSNYGGNFLDNMNQGKMLGGGGSNINVNVDLNVNRLKDLVNMWFEETFTRGMKAVL